MPVSLSSLLAFNPPLQAKSHGDAIFSVGSSAPKAIHFTSPCWTFGSKKLIKVEKQWSTCSSIANRDQLPADTNDKISGNLESSPIEDQSSAIKPTSLDSEARKSKPNTQIDNEAGTGVTSSPSPSDAKSAPKRSSLTARERLKAARVLNRYAETKAPKSEMGSKVLAALRESDRGKKRSGLPEAPTNLFDDSKRGMPKQGLTFEFPGGADLFFIVLSFVLISTLMFATTFVVWKVGAIHFNEY